jgi:DNA-binding transcriptional MerR regulator
MPLRYKILLLTGTERLLHYSARSGDICRRALGVALSAFDMRSRGCDRHHGDERDVQPDQLSLQELSAAAGMTARNVRAYQTKGLIPPPSRRGRRSVYGPEHLQRLQAIERARERGASLTLIATHLAEGRPLDEDTVIGWAPAPRGHREAVLPDGPDRVAALPPAPRDDIGSLLTALDAKRDAAAHAQVEELLAAGVFERIGPGVFTARDLATALVALQRQGLPIQAALGIAQRAMHLSRPVAESVEQAVAGLGATAGSRSQLREVRSRLGEVAGCVVRQVVINHKT